MHDWREGETLAERRAVDLHLAAPRTLPRAAGPDGRQRGTVPPPARRRARRPGGGGGRQPSASPIARPSGSASPVASTPSCAAWRGSWEAEGVVTAAPAAGAVPAERSPALSRRAGAVSALRRAWPWAGRRSWWPSPSGPASPSPGSTPASTTWWTTARTTPSGSACSTPCCAGTALPLPPLVARPQPGVRLPPADLLLARGLLPGRGGSPAGGLHLPGPAPGGLRRRPAGDVRGLRPGRDHLPQPPGGPRPGRRLRRGPLPLRHQPLQPLRLPRGDGPGRPALAAGGGHPRRAPARRPHRPGAWPSAWPRSSCVHSLSALVGAAVLALWIGATLLDTPRAGAQPGRLAAGRRRGRPRPGPLRLLLGPRLLRARGRAHRPGLAAGRSPSAPGSSTPSNRGRWRRRSPWPSATASPRGRSTSTWSTPTPRATSPARSSPAWRRGCSSCCSLAAGLSGWLEWRRRRPSTARRGRSRGALAGGPAAGAGGPLPGPLRRLLAPQHHLVAPALGGPPPPRRAAVPLAPLRAPRPGCWPSPGRGSSPGSPAGGSSSGSWPCSWPPSSSSTGGRAYAGTSGSATRPPLPPVADQAAGAGRGEPR